MCLQLDMGLELPNHSEELHMVLARHTQHAQQGKEEEEPSQLLLKQ